MASGNFVELFNGRHDHTTLSINTQHTSTTTPSRLTKTRNRLLNGGSKN